MGHWGHTVDCFQPRDPFSTETTRSMAVRPQLSNQIGMGNAKQNEKFGLVPSPLEFPLKKRSSFVPSSYGKTFENYVCFSYK